MSNIIELTSGEIAFCTDDEDKQGHDSEHEGPNRVRAVYELS